MLHKMKQAKRNSRSGNISLKNVCSFSNLYFHSGNSYYRQLQWSINRSCTEMPSRSSVYSEAWAEDNGNSTQLVNLIKKACRVYSEDQGQYFTLLLKRHFSVSNSLVQKDIRRQPTNCTKCVIKPFKSFQLLSKNDTTPLMANARFKINSL